MICATCKGSGYASDDHTSGVAPLCRDCQGWKVIAAPTPDLAAENERLVAENKRMAGELAIWMIAADNVDARFSAQERTIQDLRESAARDAGRWQKASEDWQSLLAAQAIAERDSARATIATLEARVKNQETEIAMARRQVVAAHQEVDAARAQVVALEAQVNELRRSLEFYMAASRNEST